MVGRTNIGGELKTFSDTFLDNIMDESDLKHLADSRDFWDCQFDNVKLTIYKDFKKHPIVRLLLQSRERL